MAEEEEEEWTEDPLFPVVFLAEVDPAEPGADKFMEDVSEEEEEEEEEFEACCVGMITPDGEMMFSFVEEAVSFSTMAWRSSCVNSSC